MNYSFVFFLFFSIICFGQEANYDSILNELDSLTQIKLDKGVDMLNTERNHFLNLQDLMNDIYTDLIKQDNDKTLAENQLEWVKRYNLEVSKIWNPNENLEINDGSESGLDKTMVVYSKQAGLIRKRILELIEKF